MGCFDYHAFFRLCEGGELLDRILARYKIVAIPVFCSF
jgi:hypothetical protein